MFWSFSEKSEEFDKTTLQGDGCYVFIVSEEQIKEGIWW